MGVKNGSKGGVASLRRHVTFAINFDTCTLFDYELLYVITRRKESSTVGHPKLYSYVLSTHLVVTNSTVAEFPYKAVLPFSPHIVCIRVELPYLGKP